MFETLPNNQFITQMWNRMVENLPSVLEHFLAGCSSCFVEFSAALEALMLLVLLLVLLILLAMLVA